jgi:hypothetical protein
MNRCNCNCDCCHEDEYEDDDESMYEECEDCGKYNCMCREINECHCGAWQWSSKRQEMIMVGDCIC